MIIDPNEPLPTPPAPYVWAPVTRLAAAEVLRDEYARAVKAWDDALRATEARMEVLSEALRKIAAPVPDTQWSHRQIQYQSIARAALAGREETGGG